MKKHARGYVHSLLLDFRVVTLHDLSDQHGGTIGERFTVPSNSSDADALRARFCAETSIVVRRASPRI